MPYGWRMRRWALLALTADRGGKLVYGHGLGVQNEHTESTDPP